MSILFFSSVLRLESYLINLGKTGFTWSLFSRHLHFPELCYELVASQVIRLAPKFIWFFLQHLMEKPRWSSPLRDPTGVSCTAGRFFTIRATRVPRNKSSVQSLSHVRLFATPWTAAGQASLSITNSQSLLKLMSIESVMPSNHLILCHPLLLLPPIPPGIRVFSNESTLPIRCPNYWSFSFSISPSNEHPLGVLL